MSIKAYCPQCFQKIEASDEMAGLLIKCPTCESIFSYPKKPNKRLLVLCIIAGFLACAAVANVYIKHLQIQNEQFNEFDALAKSTDSELQKESDEDARMQPLRDKADFAMMLEATNRVIGLNKIIDKIVLNEDKNPNKWIGYMTVEYVNQTGGINRKKLTFTFTNDDNFIFANENWKIDDDWERANNGDADAEYRLAICYLNGDGVAIDTNMARTLLNGAYMQGDVAAQQKLNEIGR